MKKRKLTGFALLNRDQLLAVSAKGGANAKTRHKWAPGKEAREAGRKGGKAPRTKKQ
jgi:hypothetical protein